MKIKGSVAKIDSNRVWELATAVIEYNEAVIEKLKKEIEERQSTFEARPLWYRIIYDYPQCYGDKWKIGDCRDAINHATNLVRLCTNTTDDIFLSPQDAAFIQLNSENDEN